MNVEQVAATWVCMCFFCGATGGELGDISWGLVGDRLEAGHWMLFDFARLQDPRWGDLPSITGSAVFHNLLRHVDNIVVDVLGGTITRKTARIGSLAMRLLGLSHGGAGGT